MHTTSVVEHEEYANGTVFIENGVESVELPCGEVPKNAVAIQWSTFKSHEWRNILRFYPTTHPTTLFKDFWPDPPSGLVTPKYFFSYLEHGISCGDSHYSIIPCEFKAML